MALNKLFHFVITLCLLTTVARAQSPNAKEWLRQKKTQRKYFAQQAVALQAYMEVLKKGYEIADKGLTLIGNVSGDEHSGHERRLAILLGSNKSAYPSSLVSDAKALQVSVVRRFNTLIDQCCNDQNFSSSEITYIRNVSENIRIECAASVDLLNKLVNTTALAMTEDERVSRINEVVTELNDQYEFTMEFSNSTQLLASARKKDNSTIAFFREQL